MIWYDVKVSLYLVGNGLQGGRPAFMRAVISCKLVVTGETEVNNMHLFCWKCFSLPVAFTVYCACDCVA